MNKTVLITGTSSGIGKAAVEAFSKAGWNVAATQRRPEKDQESGKLKNVRLYTLDVTDGESISNAFDNVIRDFGRIDAVVNNAGYGVDGIFEGMEDEVIRKQFNTNVFGLMRVTRKAIRLMRQQGGGTIIQVSSMGGRVTFPLYSIYHSTKWAVEGFTESLHFELLPYNIRMKIIEPGLTKTEFYGQSRVFVKPDYTDVYDNYIKRLEKIANKAMERAENPDKIAKTIVKAANDRSLKLRFPVGTPSPVLLFMKKIMPTSWFISMIRFVYKG